MLIDGRTIANHILASLISRVDELQETYDVQPHLVVIRVGDDPATTSYVNQKAKKAKEIGALVSAYNFPDTITQEKLQESIDFLQNKTDIHGLILQLPVPPHIEYEKLILDILPDKDVDGFRPNSPFTIPIASAVVKILELVYAKELEKRNLGVTRAGDPQKLSGQNEAKEAISESGESAGPQVDIINSTFHSWLTSKKIVVIGKGKTGGEPIIDILRKQGAKVTVIDSSTMNPELITKKADIIVTAVGRPSTLTADMIKKDVILLGVGLSMDTDVKFVGDYNEEEIKDIASWYTPTPGGVGPVNVACLMENLVIAAENSIKQLPS